MWSNVRFACLEYSWLIPQEIFIEKIHEFGRGIEFIV